MNKQIQNDIAGLLYLEPNSLNENDHLLDLVMDSMALVEMAIGLQDSYNVRLNNEILAEVKTVGELSSLIEKLAA